MPTAYETCQYTADTVLGVDRQKRTIDVVISDDSLDGQGHRIDQSGWDFSQFKKNPVILACHDDMSFAVAKGLPETLRTVGNKTMLTIQFPEEGQVPEADVAFYLYANGFMRAVSCGLIRQQWEMTEEDDDQGNTVPVMLIKKAKLFEVSLVAIPANDNALMKARAKKMDREDLVDDMRDHAARLEKMLSEKPAVTTTTLCIKDVAVTVQVRDGDVDAFEKEFNKVVGYFERKQPANKASTRVLAKFFKLSGTEPPAEEVDAWKVVEEKLEEVVAEVKAEEAKEEAKAEVQPVVEEVQPAAVSEVPVESVVSPAPVEEKPAPEVKPEETPPAAAPIEPSNPQPEAAAAPQPEQKSAAAPRKQTVHITLAALQALPRVLGQAYARSALEALGRGEPVKDLDGILDDVGQKLLASLIS